MSLFYFWGGLPHFLSRALLVRPICPAIFRRLGRAKAYFTATMLLQHLLAALARPHPGSSWWQNPAAHQGRPWPPDDDLGIALEASDAEVLDVIRNIPKAKVRELVGKVRPAGQPPACSAGRTPHCNALSRTAAVSAPLSRGRRPLQVYKRKAPLGSHVSRWWGLLATACAVKAAA